MKPLGAGLRALAGAAGVLAVALALNADPPREPARRPADKAAGEGADERVSVAEARARARLLHTVYAATLESMHHHFFRSDRAVLPARAMEDVFADVEGRSKVQARWIAVNTTAMSIHHEPKTEFDRQAAAALAAGKAEYDRVEDGYYRRAGVIPLRAGCVGCHAKPSERSSSTPRVAGLVISIPVRDK